MNLASGSFYSPSNVNQQIHDLLAGVLRAMERARGDGIYIFNSTNLGTVILLGQQLQDDVNIAIRGGCVYVHARPNGLDAWLFDKLGKGYYESFSPPQGGSRTPRGPLRFEMS